ncbi:MAG: TolC family protein [Henriciella sp.]|uniref:TolC family protein n=1 Tax=Henriciella sp. TaxID=1968823 RepID=UPI0032EAC31C
MKPLLLATSLLMSAPVAVAQAFLPPAPSVQASIDAHPTRQAAHEQLSAAQSEARRQAAGEYEWRLEGGYSSRDISQEGRFDEFEIGASRPIRRPGKALLDKALGKATINSAASQSVLTRRALKLELANLWMDWLAAEELARISDEQVKTYESALAAVRRQQESGQSAEVDVELAASALAEAEGVARRRQGEADIADARLQSRFPDLIKPEGLLTVSAPVSVSTSGNWQERIVAASPDLAVAEAEIRRLEARSRRARANLRPDPEVGVRAFSERGGDELGMGVFVAIPLGGPARSATSDRDLSLARAMRLETAALRRQVEADASQAVIMAASEYEAWRAADKARANSQTAIERVRRGFDLGAYDLPTRLIAEQRHGRVVMAEAEARLQARQADINMRIKAEDLWPD